ncbi:hypothetical protein GW17_00003733 [Ensete ventricosum]|nr:hypothetical protein GW17_00003733 [Ensete ventricosum]
MGLIFPLPWPYKIVVEGFTHTLARKWSSNALQDHPSWIRKLGRLDGLAKFRSVATSGLESCWVSFKKRPRPTISPSSRGCVPNVTSPMTKLAFQGWRLEVEIQKIPKVLMRSYPKKSHFVMGYNWGIYTCRAEGGHTEVFNGHDAFESPVGTILRRTLLLPIPGVSFDKAIDCQYDLLSKRRCIKTTCTCRGGCQCDLFPDSRCGPRTNVVD